MSQRDGNSIDKDVKMYFAMHNASFDAGIAAWHLKRKYNGVRPITGIRYFKQGSTIFAWGGPGQPNQNIDGAKWTPYNPGSNLTPAFPGYVSGHSTFSAASAAVLRAFTGSDNFGFSTSIPAGFGRVEPNVPPAPTTLSYPTFASAVVEAGASRLYAGIHYSDDNTVGQTLGTAVGQQAWAKAQFLFDGGLLFTSAAGAASGDSSSLSWSHTVDALSNRLLVVGVSTTDANNTVSSVSYGGAALSRLGAQNGPYNDNRVELWYRVAPPSGTATVSVRMSQRNDVVGGSMSYTGVRQQAPFGTYRAASGDSSRACVTLANAPAPLVASAIAANGDAGSVATASGQDLGWYASSKTSWWFNPFSAYDIIGAGATGPGAPMANVCYSLARGKRWALAAVPLNPAVEP